MEISKVKSFWAAFASANKKKKKYFVNERLKDGRFGTKFYLIIMSNINEQLYTFHKSMNLKTLGSFKKGWKGRMFAINDVTLHYQV